MTVGKSVFRWLGLTLLVTALVLSCEGDDGPMGPQGFQGDRGDPGQNRTPDPVADQLFGILINNSTSTDFQGALAVELTSDQAATPSNSKVVARQMDEAPVIDGLDGGSSEWGVAEASNISIASVGAADNGITSVSVRFGYNFENVYMQIKWTEVVFDPAFVAGPDTTKNQWRANTSSSWTQSGGEDRVLLAWEIGDVTGWSSQGAASVFSGATFEAPTGEMADLWTWGSTISFYGAIMQDRVVQDATLGGAMDDVGGPYVWLNDRFNNRPRYMRTNSSIAGSSYPLQDFEYTVFNRNLAWRQGATIPGYVYLEPSRSAADILAVGKYSNGTWTVELQRKRKTGHADDVLF